MSLNTYHKPSTKFCENIKTKTEKNKRKQANEEKSREKSGSRRDI
jgi:hypothetical protein